jgi:hypothetical protein
MYLVAIGWIYVALMMAVAEATNSNGSVLGGIFTFLLYGLAPVALVVYLMGAPARSKAAKAREQAAREAAIAGQAAPALPGALPSELPDGSGQAPAAAEPPGVPPVRKEP